MAGDPELWLDRCLEVCLWTPSDIFGLLTLNIMDLTRMNELFYKKEDSLLDLINSLYSDWLVTGKPTGEEIDQVAITLCELRKKHTDMVEAYFNDYMTA